MRKRFLALISVVLLSFAAVSAEPAKTAPTFHDCTLANNFGKIVLVAYCPAGIDPKQIVELTVATKSIWLQKYGFVQYRVFSATNGLPKSMNELLAKSDEWFEKYELAMATFNSATGHKDFSCRKGTAKELSDCSSLLR